MSLATREQKAVMTDFAGDGPFGPFGRQKDMKERLEENASEQLRLRTAVYVMITSLSRTVPYTILHTEPLLPVYRLLPDYLPGRHLQDLSR